MTSDFAVDGTPHAPATNTPRTLPAANSGPPCGPTAFRVSSKRQGVTRFNIEPVLAAAAVTVTVTVAVALFTAAQLFFTETQYCVVDPGKTVTDGPVAPAIGVVVVPDVPMYH